MLRGVFILARRGFRKSKISSVTAGEGATPSTSSTTAFTSTALARGFAQPPVAADRVDSPNAAPGFGISAEEARPRISAQARARLRKVLAKHRRTNVAAFSTYARKGVYPHNFTTPGRLNVWIDEEGRMCAAATMIFRSGAKKLVRDVGRDNNFIRLGDVTSGLAQRLDSTGVHDLRARAYAGDRPTVVASRRHGAKKLARAMLNLEEAEGPPDFRSVGSALKLCLLAEGKADVYPRLAPTSEWDTAAAQAVLEAAGGAVLQLSGEPVVYNKADLLNPDFVAVADPAVDWLRFFR